MSASQRQEAPGGRGRMSDASSRPTRKACSLPPRRSKHPSLEDSAVMSTTDEFYWSPSGSDVSESSPRSDPGPSREATRPDPEEERAPRRPPLPHAGLWGPPGGASSPPLGSPRSFGPSALWRRSG
ncbi:unnamed protein product, partial [Prorocentrum cordatum]